MVKKAAWFVFMLRRICSCDGTKRIYNGIKYFIQTIINQIFTMGINQRMTIKPWGKLKIILRRLHVDSNTDKGKDKIKEYPPFILSLRCVQRLFFRILVMEPRRPVRGNHIQNGAKSLWTRSVREVICAAVFNARAQKPPCSFFSRTNFPHRSTLSTGSAHNHGPPPSSNIQWDNAGLSLETCSSYSSLSLSS